MTTFFQYVQEQPLLRLFAAASIVTAGATLAKRQSNQAAICYTLAAFTAMCISRFFRNTYLIELTGLNDAQLSDNKREKAAKNLLIKNYFCGALVSALNHSATTLYVLPSISQIMKQNNFSLPLTALASAATYTMCGLVIDTLLIDNISVLNRSQMTFSSTVFHFTRFGLTLNFTDTPKNAFLGASIGRFTEKLIFNNTFKSALIYALVSGCAFGSRTFLNNVAPASLSNTFAFTAANMLLTNVLPTQLIARLLVPKNEYTKYGVV